MSNVSTAFIQAESQSKEFTHSMLTESEKIEEVSRIMDYDILVTEKLPPFID